MIGGKGSGKTVVGGALLAYWAQAMPGCKMFMAAATYNQAAESSAVKLIMACKMMNLNFVYRDKMNIDNLPHRHVYHFPDFGSNICIRSADNMDMIEGSEWNAGVIEEIQLWKEDDVHTARARIRRDQIRLFEFIAGLPEDEEYWMYEYFRTNGFDYWEIDTRENAHNLPADYISNLRRMYPGAKGERYIEGKPVSLNTTPCFSYDNKLHQQGTISRTATDYDPYRVIYVVWDFNINPCCVTLWQIKPVEQLNDYGQIIKDFVAVQINEYENWGGGTRAVCKEIIKDYGGHVYGFDIFGDATGNSEDTRNASVTDYTIIGDEFRGLPNVVLKQGLLINRGKRGRGRRRGSRYSNPPVKLSIQHANSLLVRPDGTTGVVFLPQSRYESGGAAKSVRLLRYDAQGRVDESNDRSEGRAITRTHFADTFRYLTWYVTGGQEGGRIIMSGTRGKRYELTSKMQIGKKERPKGIF